MKICVLLIALVYRCFAATTVELLASDPNLSTLVSLVKQAGLVDAINSGQFTIFAPTNAAFAKLPAATVSALTSDVKALTNILKYHVVQGGLYSAAAKNELQLATLNGQNIRFNIYSQNNVVTVQGSKILQFDRTASNGVIHVIDSVMMPPEGDIVDIVAKTPEFSTLLSLVQQAGLVGPLRGDSMTVFAPTNAAFAKLPSQIVDRLTHDKALLADILEYHVSPETEYSVGLFNGERLGSVDTNHDLLTIHADASGVHINRDAQVTKADIGATNGVIHVIDHVLVPARYQATLAVGK